LKEKEKKATRKILNKKCRTIEQVQKVKKRGKHSTKVEEARQRAAERSKEDGRKERGKALCEWQSRM